MVTLAALWYRLLVQEPSTASGGETAMVKAAEQPQLSYGARERSMADGSAFLI